MVIKISPSELINMDESDIPKIKVFDLSDESLKLLGELLTNESSRSIILALIENQMYVNQLAEKLDMRVSLVIHHLKKLGKLGLLEIIEKPITKRTKDHKFFKINTDVFLSFTIDETGNKLKRIFKDGIKFTSVGLISAMTYFLSFIELSVNRDLDVDSTQNSFYESIIYSLLVIIVGISIIYIIEKKK